MATVNEILEFIGLLAPEYMKESWDRVGLNCGHGDREVHKVLVALDPFDEVCEEAAEIGADLLVTHHALIWDPGFITDDTLWGRRALFLIENQIAHINAHTNLDCAPGGVNDILAQTLGLQDIQVIEPVGEDEDGQPYGLLRCGTLEEMPLDEFLEQVKFSLGTPVLRFARGSDSVRKVAVGGGACAGAMDQAIAAGCDTFVTADIKYNQFWDARDRGLTIIDAGHFYTENPVCTMLAAAIGEAFPEIQVVLSQKHRDVMEFA